mmetsp:Transcript_19572/g.42181  ORF Transcript_19572/g.42181 Transcript_19572/m.42181 type:complete len:328 (+) Transcript_19572:42-1025(+)
MEKANSAKTSEYGEPTIHNAFFSRLFSSRVSSGAPSSTTRRVQFTLPEQSSKKVLVASTTSSGMRRARPTPREKSKKVEDQEDCLNLVMRQQTYSNRWSWSADTTFRVLYDRRYHPNQRPEQQIFPWTVQNSAGVERDRIIVRNWPQNEPRFMAIRTSKKVPTQYDIYSMSRYKDEADDSSQPSSSSSSLLNVMHRWGTVTCHDQDRENPVFLTFDMVDGVNQYCVKLDMKKKHQQQQAHVDSDYWRDFLITYNGVQCARIRSSRKRHTSIMVGMNGMASHQYNSWELAINTKTRRSKDRSTHRRMAIHPAILLLLTTILREIVLEY